VLKDKLTNMAAIVSLSLSTFLGSAAAFNLKIPPQTVLLLAAASSLLTGATSYATGKNDDLSSK
jgi:hypothetical protein